MKKVLTVKLSKTIFGDQQLLSYVSDENPLMMIGTYVESIVHTVDQSQDQNSKFARHPLPPFDFCEWNITLLCNLPLFMLFFMVVAMPLQQGQHRQKHHQTSQSVIS